jgi:hypothetical protein
MILNLSLLAFPSSHAGTALARSANGRTDGRSCLLHGCSANGLKEIFASPVGRIADLKRQGVRLAFAWHCGLFLEQVVAPRNSRLRLWKFTGDVRPKPIQDDLI